MASILNDSYDSNRVLYYLSINGSTEQPQQEPAKEDVCNSQENTSTDTSTSVCFPPTHANVNIPSICHITDRLITIDLNKQCQNASDVLLKDILFTLLSSLSHRKSIIRTYLSAFMESLQKHFGFFLTSSFQQHRIVESIGLFAESKMIPNSAKFKNEFAQQDQEIDAQVEKVKKALSSLNSLVSTECNSPLFETEYKGSLNIAEHKSALTIVGESLNAALDSLFRDIKALERLLNHYSKVIAKSLPNYKEFLATSIRLQLMLTLLPLSKNSRENGVEELAFYLEQVNSTKSSIENTDYISLACINQVQLGKNILTDIKRLLELLRSILQEDFKQISTSLDSILQMIPSSKKGIFKKPSVLLRVESFSYEVDTTSFIHRNSRHLYLLKAKCTDNPLIRLIDVFLDYLDKLLEETKSLFSCHHTDVVKVILNINVSPFNKSDTGHSYLFNLICPTQIEIFEKLPRCLTELINSHKRLHEELTHELKIIFDRHCTISDTETNLGELLNRCIGINKKISSAIQSFEDILNQTLEAIEEIQMSLKSKSAKHRVILLTQTPQGKRLSAGYPLLLISLSVLSNDIRICQSKVQIFSRTVSTLIKGHLTPAITLFQLIMNRIVLLEGSETAPSNNSVVLLPFADFPNSICHTQNVFREVETLIALANQKISFYISQPSPSQPLSRNQKNSEGCKSASSNNCQTPESNFDIEPFLKTPEHVEYAFMSLDFNKIQDEEDLSSSIAPLTRLLEAIKDRLAHAKK